MLDMMKRGGGGQIDLTGKNGIGDHYYPISSATIVMGPDSPLSNRTSSHQTVVPHRSNSLDDVLYISPPYHL